MLERVVWLGGCEGAELRYGGAKDGVRWKIRAESAKRIEGSRRYRWGDQISDVVVMFTAGRQVKSERAPSLLPWQRVSDTLITTATGRALLIGGERGIVSLSFGLHYMDRKFARDHSGSRPPVKLSLRYWLRPDRLPKNAISGMVQSDV